MIIVAQIGNIPGVIDAIGVGRKCVWDHDRLQGQ